MGEAPFTSTPCNVVRGFTHTPDIDPTEEEVDIDGLNAAIDALGAAIRNQDDP